jgi:hypothetical protein
MPNYGYNCATCGREIVVFRPLTLDVKKKLRRLCDTCLVRRTFERSYNYSGFAFGLLNEKLRGGSAAVKGWGTHNLDYGKSKSDLVNRRAIEHTSEQLGYDITVDKARDRAKPLPKGQV